LASLWNGIGLEKLLLVSVMEPIKFRLNFSQGFCHLSTHSTSFSFDVFPSIKEEEETSIRRFFLPSFCCLSDTSSIILEKNRKGKDAEA
jgi:hypothetical protein